MVTRSQKTRVARETIGPYLKERGFRRKAINSHGHPTETLWSLYDDPPSSDRLIISIEFAAHGWTPVGDSFTVNIDAGEWERIGFVLDEEQRQEAARIQEEMARRPAVIDSTLMLDQARRFRESRPGDDWFCFYSEADLRTWLMKVVEWLPSAVASATGSAEFHALLSVAR